MYQCADEFVRITAASFLQLWYYLQEELHDSLCECHLLRIIDSPAEEFADGLVVREPLGK